MSSRILPADQVSFEGASCAFGVFDGVHRGHRFIIDRAVTDAGARGAKAIIITFSVDPEDLFHPESNRKLLTDEERIHTLSELGADEVAVIPFDGSVASMEPVAFLEDIFSAGAPHVLFVGEDVRFGRKAAGSIDDLRAWGEPRGMHTEAVALLEADGAPVTSTRIRRCLAEGNLAEAADLLGRPISSS